MSTSKKIVLKSSDGETFEIEEAVALGSQTIAHMVEDDCVNDVIPLPNITGEILAKVIEYCKKHVVKDGDSSSSEEEIKIWDAEFMKMDQAVLFNLTMAANFLNIQNLLDLTCQTIADMIKGKTPDEIRSIFHIEKDFSTEEEEKIRQENPWAFE